MFLLLLRAPHLITDLCSLLFLKFRLLWLKSLSVLASAWWHKINPHIKNKTTKLVKLHWGTERKNKNALEWFENAVCSTAIKGNAIISWYYPYSQNCVSESAVVTHSRTPGAGGPCWVWCPRAWVRHRHPAGVGSCPEEHASATGQQEWAGENRGSRNQQLFFFLFGLG